MRNPFSGAQSRKFHPFKGVIIDPPNLCTISVLNLLRAIAPTDLRPRLAVVTSTGITTASHRSLLLVMKPLYAWLLLLGSDTDASYLDEIQVIELLVLVPALLVRAPSSVCAHASPHAYDPALSQIPAGPSRIEWSLDGFHHMVLRYSFVML